MSRHIHLVVPGLFLPGDIATRACAGLDLPALEKTLGRARQQVLAATTLESWLCATFGVEGDAVAPVTLQADGVAPGTSYWLRADPVHLGFYHDQLIARPVAPLKAEEATQLCTVLNEHFAADGMHFIAAHPERWYLGLERPAQIATFPLAQVAGRAVDTRLPHGPDALRWHRTLNEIQMVLFTHPLNEVREAQGRWTVNSVWLWGGGHGGTELQQPFRRVFTDSPLAAAFAAVAGIHHAPLPTDAGHCNSLCISEVQGETLIVWDGLRTALQRDDLGGWRDSLLQLERNCVQPLLQGLRAGRIGTITLDVLHENGAARFVMTRQAAWKFWRRRRLDTFALV